MASNTNPRASYKIRVPTTFEDSLDGVMSGYIEHSNTYKHNIQGLIQKNSPALMMIIPDSVITARKTKLTRDLGKSFKTTDKFILTSIDEYRAERTQILETFGKPSIFFFDEGVRNYTLNGLLIDNFISEEDINSNTNLNWADNFKRFYEEHLRATKLAIHNEIVLISVNDNLIYGYPTSLNMNTNSTQPHIVGFSMGFLVLKHTFPKAIPPSGNRGYDIWKALDIQFFEDRLDEIRDDIENLNGEVNSELEELKEKEKDINNKFIPLLEAEYAILLKEMAGNQSGSDISSIINKANIKGIVTKTNYEDDYPPV